MGSWSSAPRCVKNNRRRLTFLALDDQESGWRRSAQEDLLSCTDQLNPSRGDSPVARRSRVSTSRLGSGVKHAVSESQARSTAGGDSVDVELWALDRDAGCRRLVDHLILAVEPRDIGRSTSNIESDCKSSTPRQREGAYPMTGARSLASQLVRA